MLADLSAQSGDGGSDAMGQPDAVKMSGGCFMAGRLRHIFQGQHQHPATAALPVSVPPAIVEHTAQTQGQIRSLIFLGKKHHFIKDAAPGQAQKQLLHRILSISRRAAPPACGGVQAMPVLTTESVDRMVLAWRGGGHVCLRRITRWMEKVETGSMDEFTGSLHWRLASRVKARSGPWVNFVKAV